MPNITYAAAQPSQSNACGAFCLAAALTALNRTPDTDRELSYAFLVNFGGGARLYERQTDLKTRATPQDLAVKLYRVSGLLSMNPVQYEAQPGNFFSPPSALMWLAWQLGCQPVINLFNATYQSMTAVFPSEELLISNSGFTINNNVTAYAAPGASQINLVCVSQDQTTLTPTHWVAQGANGWYDPADGSNGNGWTNPTNPGDAVGTDYYFTGMWINLS